MSELQKTVKSLPTICFSNVRPFAMYCIWILSQAQQQMCVFVYMQLFIVDFRRSGQS